MWEGRSPCRVSGKGGGFRTDTRSRPSLSGWTCRRNFFVHVRGLLFEVGTCEEGIPTGLVSFLRDSRTGLRKWILLLSTPPTSFYSVVHYCEVRRCGPCEEFPGSFGPEVSTEESHPLHCSLPRPPPPARGSDGRLPRGVSVSERTTGPYLTMGRIFSPMNGRIP